MGDNTPTDDRDNAWAEFAHDAGYGYTDTESNRAFDAGWDAARALSESSPFTPTDDEREVRAAVRRAVGGVLFNVSNFPERVHSRLPGQNMGPLNEKITDAVLDVLGRANAPAEDERAYTPTDDEQRDWRDKAWNAASIGRTTPTQSEPSDAQAALRAWRDYWDRDEGGNDEDAMRAALSAAGVAK